MTIDQQIGFFLNEVKVWSKKLKVFPLAVQIERIKPWGQCMSNGVVVFSVDLLFNRKELQTYVIVHELLHLKISNHGRLFRAVLSVYVPNWIELDRELNGQEKVTDLSG